MAGIFPAPILKNFQKPIDKSREVCYNKYIKNRKEMIT